jgi:hypothetical protein
VRARRQIQCNVCHFCSLFNSNQRRADRSLSRSDCLYVSASLRRFCEIGIEVMRVRIFNIHISIKL